MRSHYSSDDPLVVLRSCLSKPCWHNLILLVLALTLVRSCILWQVAVAVILPIRLESCYQRLKRLLACTGIDWHALQQAWIRWVLGPFAQPTQPLLLLIDWTLHTDRCRSLWVQLVAGGGRSIPLAFWLTANSFGGAGKQRAFEDAALRQLRDGLPEGWPVILIGDRGFGGRDRMRFVARLGWSFVFRITGDGRLRVRQRVRGRRGWRWRSFYVRVDAAPPAAGQRWFKAEVRYGRHQAVTVNLAAAAIAGPTGKVAVWYLATNLPASVDVVALYALRMQIEQSFRDYKSSLGLEREYTRQPARRLQWLLFAVMVVAGRQTWQGRRSLQEPVAACIGRVPTEATPDAAAGESGASGSARRYRVVSDFRRGWHEALTELVLSDAAVRQAVQEAAAKAQRMQQRPQVWQRRKPLPTKSRSRTRSAPQPATAA
jgi:hypothetical protein